MKISWEIRENLEAPMKNRENFVNVRTYIHIFHQHIFIDKHINIIDDVVF